MPKGSSSAGPSRLSVSVAIARNPSSSVARAANAALSSS